MPRWWKLLFCGRFRNGSKRDGPAVARQVLAPTTENQAVLVLSANVAVAEKRKHATTAFEVRRPAVLEHAAVTVETVNRVRGPGQARARVLAAIERHSMSMRSTDAVRGRRRPVNQLQDRDVNGTTADRRDELEQARYNTVSATATLRETIFSQISLLVGAGNGPSTDRRDEEIASETQRFATVSATLRHVAVVRARLRRKQRHRRQRQQRRKR